MLTKFLSSPITRTQRLLLKSDSSLAFKLYYLLAKIHFKIHFGTSLEEAVLEDRLSGKMAADRHGRLIIHAFFPHLTDSQKEKLGLKIKEAFVKNIILTAKI